MNTIDYVVLVDKKNNVLGTAPKPTVHSMDTPLHRAFSLFIFNSEGQLLLQQRGKNKKTWPLIWSNSCCGHPMLKEANIDAAKRRAKFELGINIEKAYEILPNFSYKAELNGIVENEICPVIVAFTENEPLINKNEVESIRWIKWNDFLNEINSKLGSYSVWCEQETKLLSVNNEFMELYKNFVK